MEENKEEILTINIILQSDEKGNDHGKDIKEYGSKLIATTAQETVSNYKSKRNNTVSAKTNSPMEKK